MESLGAIAVSWLLPFLLRGELTVKPCPLVLCTTDIITGPPPPLDSPPTDMEDSVFCFKRLTGFFGNAAVAVRSADPVVRVDVACVDPGLSDDVVAICPSRLQPPFSQAAEGLVCVVDSRAEFRWGDRNFPAASHSFATATARGGTDGDALRGGRCPTDVRLPAAERPPS